jgi:putative salt-induced outer membrane protein YdiY
MSGRHLSFVCCALALSGCLAPAWADVLTLSNGDRLSGTVLRKQGDSVVLRTAYAGDVSVKWSEVTGITTAKPVHVILSDESSIKGELLAADAGHARVKAGEIIETAPFDLAKLTFINPPPEVSGQGAKISGRVNVGVISTSGNTDTENIHLDGEWIARTRDNRFTVGGAFNRAKDQGTESASNGHAYIKYDHFVTKQWYVYANSTVERDRFKDLNLRTTLGVGSGYQIYESPELNLQVEGGVNYVNEDFRLMPDDRFPSARWALKYNQMLFGGATQLFHEHEWLISLEDTKDMIAKTKTGLRFPLSKQFEASTQVDVDWDRTPPAGKDSTDTKLLFTVGYRW